MTGPDTPEFRPKARRPRGLQDRRGAALAAEAELVAKISRVYEAWGFERLETSAFEYADALGKFLPDQDRPNEGVFALQDDDEQWLALRYDLTAPLARFVAENYDALPKPYRRWAAGPVWRNEKPGPGRFREFWQCDADTVGSASPAADAELIAMACAALRAVGIPEEKFALKISTRQLLDGLLARVATPGQRLKAMRSIDKLDRLGIEGVKALLGSGRKDESGDFTEGANLSAGDTDLIIAFLSVREPTRRATLKALSELPFKETVPWQEGMRSLQIISDVLDTLKIDDAQAQIDPSIVRGLEYYTGAVFEAQLIGGDGASFGSVGGGGRYDDLVSRFRGEPIPATGFSVGVSRLAAALQADAQNAEVNAPVVVLVMDQARVADAFAMADELRRAGVRAEAYLGAGGMKAQLKYADKRGAPVAVIQGGDELAKGVVTLKDLKLGEKLAADAGSDREAWNEARKQLQVEVKREELVAGVQRMLGR
ncbi:MAG: histidine--tRNA ligase [Pseudomonadota bacterium]